ncbi:MAG TPA: hypothetical protein VFX22_10905, partial [Candidatus Kapabacteria bacterium]|nr:hypothetical protein [Candidatus Kapabacteria bacterium]
MIEKDIRQRKFANWREIHLMVIAEIGEHLAEEIRLGRIRGSAGRNGGLGKGIGRRHYLLSQEFPLIVNIGDLNSEIGEIG